MYEDPTPADWSMNIASRSLVHLCGLGRKLPSTLITRRPGWEIQRRIQSTRDPDGFNLNGISPTPPFPFPDAPPSPPEVKAKAQQLA